MWSTMDKTEESVVKYSLNGERFMATGASLLFVDGGKKKHQQYIHKVLFRPEIFLAVNIFSLIFPFSNS